MKARNFTSLFQKVLLPIVFDCDCAAAVQAARLIAGKGQVVLLGVVTMADEESLSAASLQARKVRGSMRRLRRAHPTSKVCEPVRVTYQPWEEICKQAEREAADVLVLQWPEHFEALKLSLSEILARPPCDLVIAGGSILEHPKHILTPLRGGPNAELALRVSLAVSHSTAAKITSLHVVPPDMEQYQDAPYRGLEQILGNMPRLEKKIIETADPGRAILDQALNYPLTIMGATAAAAPLQQGFGRVAQEVLCNTPGGVLIVRAKRNLPRYADSAEAGITAISVLVDQWFAENTYEADEFKDLDYLIDLKQRQGVTVSLALPALNEEATVGKVIGVIKSTLMDQKPLLDEIVLIDSQSTDATREIAASLGVPVYIHQETLPDHEPRRGKGDALWKSLFVTRGEILLWVDTDIVNIHPRFVYGILGPLLLRPEIQFVKGFYRRPLKVGDKVQAGGGGRVTELAARPMINLFYPEISGIIQPLSGEYGGRRSALERLPFFSGYGVEIGLLIDVFEQFGLEAIAQVDLLERIHHNQSLESLSKMSFAIIQAVMRKLERRYNRSFVNDLNKSMKLIRHEPGRYYLDIEEIAELERPPMILLEEYREAMQS